MELPTKSPLLERVFRGIPRAHAVAGTKSCVRRPVSWDMLLEGETLVPSWGQRRPGPLALFSPGVFFDDAV